jgi:large subunit ribosomal protein L24
MGLHRKALKDMFATHRWHIVRGDTVIIRAGKDKGQVGVVTKVVRDKKQPRVVVEGRNLNKKSVKRTKDQPGGIITIEAPIHYSNVSLAVPDAQGNQVPCRVAWRFTEDGKKVRVAQGHNVQPGYIIPWPDRPARIRPTAGSRDTPATIVEEVTYQPGQLPVQLASIQQGVQQQAQRQYSTAAAADCLRHSIHRKAALDCRSVLWLTRGFAAWGLS